MARASARRPLGARKGSRANPLNASDLPFMVPKAGRYWLEYGNRLIQMPESPKGSVIDFEDRPE